MGKSAATINLSDSDQQASSSSLAPHIHDPTTMLPTPSKTPRKRHAAAISSMARPLNFQPLDPNDVMPSPRKFKKHGRFNSMNAFDLYDDEPMQGVSGPGIEVYTDANARVPELDQGEDNPFVGPKRAAGRPQTRSRRARTAAEEEMEAMTRREEGVVYVL
jgi:hypothetical protein